MPPKRKAAQAVTAESPPNKRRLRNQGTTIATHVESQLSSTPAKRTRAAVKAKDISKRLVEVAAVDGSASSSETSRPGPDTATPRRSGRGRPTPVGPIETTANTCLRGSIPSTSKTTLDSMVRPRQEGHQGDEDDPLLLTSQKRETRPVTPPRTSAPNTPGTSTRRFMHSVEIVMSPARLMRSPALQHIASPSVNLRRSRAAIQDRLDTAAVGSPSRKQHIPFPFLPSTPSKRGHVPYSDTSPSRVSLATSAVQDSASPSLQLSLVNKAAVTPPVSPSKRGAAATSYVSPKRLPPVLPPHLHQYLSAQQRAVLTSLQMMHRLAESSQEVVEADGPPTNVIAHKQLCELLIGTVNRGEGNSCLVIGPRGSGKTQLIERAIAALPEQPIIIRLSGYAQTNDRVAIREIAWQLARQTGTSLLPLENDEGANGDPENPFVDIAEPMTALPPPSHLLALISTIPTLSRPTVIIIDAFDLFATHARQSLLYCLLDTVQNCRVSSGCKGMAVIGVTTRVDTITMLEKRVKSRFSGRMLRTACPGRLEDWLHLARASLCTPIETGTTNEWSPIWESAVERFLQDQVVIGILKESFSLTRDVRTLCRLLTKPVAGLTPTSPFPSATELIASVNTQRCPPAFPFLNSLSYPSICLLIAAVHAQTSGHDTFTFEMLHEAFRDQVRTSQSAPVQVDGGSIGMVRCSREVLVGSFERLAALRVFIATAPSSIAIAKEYARYRCTIDRLDVKQAVERMGQVNLKKWLNKA